MRRGLILVSAVPLAAAIALIFFLLRVHDSSDGAVSVLIGTFTSGRLVNLAALVGFCALGAGLCAVPVVRWWLLLVIPLRLAAIAAAVLAAGLAWMTSSVSVVPLASAGCETGYVVVERSFLLGGSGTVYRVDGVYVTEVAHTIGDDGYHPFFDGAYTVQEKGDVLEVWYSVEENGGEPASATGSHPQTRPSPSPFAPIPRVEVAADLADLVRASLGSDSGRDRPTHSHLSYAADPAGERRLAPRRPVAAPTPSDGRSSRGVGSLRPLGPRRVFPSAAESATFALRTGTGA